MYNNIEEVIVMQTDGSISNAEKWDAVINRNKSYDGIFYYAVKTTGIFCRPSCKARAPLKKNTLFFNNADDAIEEGFRPCKLCRPDINEDTYEPNRDLVQKIREKLNQNYNKPLDLRLVSMEFSVSVSHLTRLFKEYTGVTPKEYITQIRLNKAMLLLSESNENILEVAYAIGFKSLSSFYKCFKDNTGCTPKEYRKSSLAPLK